MEKFDAIVVGSGAGGLVSGAYLSAAGRSTLVLEAYDVIGGCTHAFRRAGKWEFDVGVHYLGDCGPDGQIPTILRGVGVDQHVEFLPLADEAFDTIVFPDLTVEIPRGWDNYERNLVEAFPAEETAIRSIVRILRRLGASIDRSSTPASLAGLAKFIGDAGLTSRWALRSLTALLNAHNISPELTAVLSVQYGTYASPPHRTPVAVHAIMLEGFLQKGAWFPRGGGQVISARLGQVIVANGGELRTRTRVKSILIEAGRAVGVELGDGTRIAADVVVSNADIKKTYLELVGPQHLRARTVKKVQRWRMSQPFFNTYLGVDIDLTETVKTATNFYSIPETFDFVDFIEQVGEAYSPLTPEERLRRFVDQVPGYVSITTTKDPRNPYSAPAGSSVLEVMTVAPRDPQFWGLQHWPTDDSYQHNSDYQRVKEAFTQAMVDRAAAVIPGLEDHIVWRESATPFTHHRYTGATEGTPYGLEMSTWQFAPFRPRSRTEIKGLFLCGGSMAWGPALEGAMLSGFHAAAAVLDRDLHNEVRKGTTFGCGLDAPPSEDVYDDALAAAKALATRGSR